MASSKTGNKTEKKVTDMDRIIPQIKILRKMSEGVDNVKNIKQYQIHELAAYLGGDEGETQRSLYILEGHKFVTPHPAGDFTSKTWQITEGGLLAAKSLANQGRLF